MAEQIHLLQKTGFESPEGQEILSLLRSDHTDEACRASYEIYSDGCFSGNKDAGDGI